MKTLTLIISVAVLFTACSKNDDAVTPLTQNPVNQSVNYTYYDIPVTSAAQFKGEIDGLSTNWVEGSAGIENNASVSYSGNNSTLGTEFVLIENGNIVEKLTFAKRYINKSNLTDTANVRQFLTPANYSYTKDNGIDGIVVTYIDSNGKVWTSKGDNTTSPFTITKIKTAYTNPCSVNTYEVKTKIDFGCKLYNNNKSITISGSALSKFAVAQ